jgi:ABC-type Fe3+-hydroxamate transport system substrate-binding protein
MGVHKVYSYRQEEVEIPDNPQRIVSFSPSITEILFELGLADQIVGISAFCVRPPETAGKRKIGSYGFVRHEILDDIRPDLVFTISGYQDKFTAELAKNYPVVCVELPVSLAGIIDLPVKIGIITGKREEGRNLSYRLMKSLPAPRREIVGSCYLEIDLASPIAFGAFSYITDALRYMGLQSIYSEQNREWISSSLDFVHSADPDMIIYEAKMFSKYTEHDLEETIKNRGWSDLKAVSNKMVFKTPGNLDFFAHHGPSFVREVMPWLDDKVNKLQESLRKQ